MFNKKLKEEVKELRMEVTKLKLDKFLKENGMEKCSLETRSEFYAYFIYGKKYSLNCYLQTIVEASSIEEILEKLTGEVDYYKFKYNQINTNGWGNRK